MHTNFTLKLGLEFHNLYDAWGLIIVW